MNIQLGKKLFTLGLLSTISIASSSVAFNKFDLTFPHSENNINSNSHSSLQLAKKTTYEIYLTGIACYRESKHVWGARADEPFVIVGVSDSRGNITEKVIPAPNSHFSAMNQGDMRRLNYRVWSGGVQTVVVSGQLWEYDNAQRKAAKTFADISDIAAVIGAAAISVASGGTAAVGAAAGVVALNKFNDQTRKSLEGALHDHLGTASTTVELRRVGSLADAPQARMGPIQYDFHTDHRGDGGDYKLFWEVRRY